MKKMSFQKLKELIANGTSGSKNHEAEHSAWQEPPEASPVEAAKQSGAVCCFCLPPGIGSFGGPLTPTFSLVALGVSALGWGKLLT